MCHWICMPQRRNAWHLIYSVARWSPGEPDGTQVRWPCGLPSNTRHITKSTQDHIWSSVVGNIGPNNFFLMALYVVVFMMEKILWVSFFFETLERERENGTQPNGRIVTKENEKVTYYIFILLFFSTENVILHSNEWEDTLAAASCDL